ncbi:MAG TPA: tRNA lysidine(34) synthetase TilS, partial [Anaerolineales bacterium]
MLENIQTVLLEQCGLNHDHPVIAGVSGGPDSLCLMSILHKARYRVIVAHFNHKLRPDADADANVVEQTAARLNIASVVESGDVRAFADAEKLSIEEAARIMRYRFLMAQARRFKAQAVAVGHTADDQVETVLMHFLRGAGLTGLKGMSHRTILPAFDAEIPVVRPLLDVWREETLAFCVASGLQPVMDPSNESLNFTRNRLRRTLIPILETYNPRFREAVWRSAQTLKADHAILRETVETAWQKCVKSQDADMIVFDLPELMTFSGSMQRNLLRLAVAYLRPSQETGFALLNRATAFIKDPAATRTDLSGGLKLFREGTSLYLTTPGANLPLRQWPQIPEEMVPVKLSVPGVVEFPDGWKLSVESWRLPALAREQAAANRDPFQVWLDAERLPDGLELRTRQAGDRFEPLGLEGHSQKLSDFMVNVKMPQRARDNWPLVCA